MRRRVLVLVLALVAGGCDDYRMVITNDCAGSEILVRDGEGRVLATKIVYGEGPRVVELKAYRGQTIKLIAYGWTLEDRHPIGSETTSRTIYSGSITGPQIDPWSVRSLYDSDYRWNCYSGSWR